MVSNFSVLANEAKATTNESFLSSEERQTICTFLSDKHVICNGTVFDLPERQLRSSDALFWIYLAIYIALVIFAGLMSGLTLAILSLDLTGLKVIQAAGSRESARYARRIMPFVKRRHLVLVTLVLANAACVEAMPIFMDRISDPITAVLVSCTAVLIFGEVLPQAVSSRFGLKVGYMFAWLVWALVGLFFVIALPFSYLLDCLLGRDSGMFYGRNELKALVDIHGPPPPESPTKEHDDDRHHQNRKASLSCHGHSKSANDIFPERLSFDEVLIIKGALSMSEKRAVDAMVKLDDVFMLSIDTVFNSQCLKDILEIGHSRIPIYENERTNVLGVFLTKRLISIDPNQRITLRQLIEETTVKSFYQVLRVDENMPLYELMNNFQTGTMSHIAFVTRKKGDKEELIGIVTLEDVIEELLQEEIFDESDVKRTPGSSNPLNALALPKLYRQLVPSNPKEPTKSRSSARLKNKAAPELPKNQTFDVLPTLENVNPASITTTMQDFSPRSPRIRIDPLVYSPGTGPSHPVNNGAFQNMQSKGSNPSIA